MRQARLHRLAYVLLSVAISAAVFAFPSTVGAAPPAYVGLGDSYASAPLVPTQIMSARGCLRADHNYAHLVAAAIKPSSFKDASCSGATTKNMTQSQSVVGGTNAPQLDRLSASTGLVTLEIGGNDIGFTSIVLHCASLVPWGSPCKNHYVHGSVDDITTRINAAAAKVSAVLSAVAGRSPHARVFVLGYPAILPNSGGGCWPKMPITSNDVSYLRAKEKQLNSMIAGQAVAHHATYVDVYTPSIGHDACSSSATRWIEPVVPTHLAAPVHPNSTGEKGMATAVRGAMGL
jgi:GDSL-like lipase/acylhydrolase family protein